MGKNKKLRKENLVKNAFKIENLPEPPEPLIKFRYIQRRETLEEIPEYSDLYQDYIKSNFDFFFGKSKELYTYLSRKISSKRAEINKIFFIILFFGVIYFMLTGFKETYAVGGPVANGEACSYDSMCINLCDNQTYIGLNTDSLRCFSSGSCHGGAGNCNDSMYRCEYEAGADPECDDYMDSSCLGITFCDLNCYYKTLAAPGSLLNLTVINSTEYHNSRIGEMFLNWSNNSDNTDSFAIFRSTDNITFTNIYNLSYEEERSFSDSTDDNTLYFYKISARNSESSCFGGNTSVSHNITVDRTSPITPRLAVVEWFVSLFFDFDHNISFYNDYDASAFGNSIVTAYGTLWLPATGYRQGGVEFDGQDYLNISDSSSLDILNELTIETWMKINTSGQNSAIIVKGDEETVATFNYGLYFYKGSLLRGWIGNGATYNVVQSNITLNTGTWTHIAFVVNSTNLILFINGTRHNQSAKTITLTNSSRNLMIGADSNGLNNFNGTLDNIKIYTRALGSQEIFDSYNNTLKNVTTKVDLSWSHQEDGLQLYLPFEEGFGNTTRDWSNKKNNGKLNGTTWINSGKYGNALQFNKSNNNFVNLTDFDFGNSLTASMWIKFNETTSQQMLISQGSSAGLEFQLQMQGSSSNTFRARVDTSGGSTIKDSTTSAVSDKWYFVAFTYDGSVLNLYVDGIKEGINNSISGTIVDNNVYTLIGGWPTSLFANATIDEVRIYNRSLTQREIINDMQSGLIKKEIFASGSMQGPYTQIDGLISDTNMTSSSDTGPPNEVSNLQSTSHTAGRWSNDVSVDLSWTGAVDTGNVTWYYLRAYDEPGNSNNLLENGTIEKGTLGQNVAGWGLFYPSHVYLILNDTRGYTGFRSGLIDNPGAGVNRSFYAPIPIPDRYNQYRYGGCFYSDGPSVGIYFRGTRTASSFTGAGLNYITNSTTDQWVCIEGTSTEINDTLNYLILGVYNNGGGKVWFDDLFIYPLKNSTGQASGIDGYAIACNQSSEDIDNTTKGIEDTETTYTCTFPEGSSHYFHIRSVDNVANWGATSADIGPFLIDLTNPTLGTAYIENGYNTYFSGSTYYYNGTIKIATTWSDALSGIAAGTYPCNYTTDNGATNPWPSGLYNATHCYSPPITPTTDIIINFNISDNASNNAVGTARTYVRDNTAPTCSITSIKVNNSYGYNNSATSTIYYNNASVGSWNITVAISDAGSGVKNVTFPLLATISGSGGDLSYPHRSDDINAYKWNLTSTFNTTANFTCYDNLTNANIVTYTVRRDISPPSYGAINYTNGTYYTLSVLVNLSNGTDGANGAGVNASKARILRRNVTITADACGSWENVWYAINSSAPTSPFNDTTIANGKCYQYRYEVWDYIHNGVNFTSENIVKANGNNPPTTPTLYLPTKGNRTYHDRRPTFTWNSTDPDFNLINYTINISFSSAIACGPDISISLNVSNYTPTYDFCVDSIINWTVRAYDGTSYSSWSEMWNFTIESFISLNLTTAAIDFGTMAPGENRHTDAGGGGYSPLILENTGNVMINITKISANSSPWMTQPLNTVYIRFKADNITSEPRSFNYTGSAVNWTNLTAIDILNQTIIQNLDYNDSKDSAEIDLNITVPLDEIPGTRRFTIYLIGEQA